MLRILSATLQKEGFTVRTSQDGKQGLDAALLEMPDLILLDLLLPTMPGTEVLKALRADKRGATVPVMIVTNLDENDTIYKSVAKASSTYIIKSNSSLAYIVQEVKRLLTGDTGQTQA